jgi:hypothetical protein
VGCFDFPLPSLSFAAISRGGFFMTTQRLINGALALLGSVVITSGCTAHARGTAYTEAEAPVVTVDNPTLVEVDTGVWVIRDYDEPVYFVSDDYWVYRHNAWYRSHGYDGGWVVVEATVVPSVIVHRDHRVYVHYRGAAAAQTRAAPRRQRDSDHHGQPDHPVEPPHGGQPDRADARGPSGERRAEERHEGPGEHKEHAEHHERHDDARGTDNQRPGGKKQEKEKDRGKKR